MMNFRRTLPSSFGQVLALPPDRPVRVLLTRYELRLLARLLDAEADRAMAAGCDERGRKLAWRAADLREAAAR